MIESIVIFKQSMGEISQSINELTEEHHGKESYNNTIQKIA